MKTKLLIALCALSVAGVSSAFAKDDWRHANTDKNLIVRVESQKTAFEYSAAVARYYHGGTYGRVVGRSMGYPQTYVGVFCNDYEHTGLGDRVLFTDRDGKRICHRVVAKERGFFVVSGETYPQRIDWVCLKNYVGTVVSICVW